MKILYVTSEASPFVASGGLGDVMGALPPQIASERSDITCEVILPLYKSVKREFREKCTRWQILLFNFHGERQALRCIATNGEM